MAKVKSNTFSMIRGSVGALTYSCRQETPIVVYNRFVPAYPLTIYQQRANDAWRFAIDLWTSTSEANRKKWADYAKTLRFSNALGAIEPTGRLAFMGCISLARRMRYECGNPPLPTGIAPTVGGFPILLSPRPVTGIAGQVGFRIRLRNGSSDHLWIMAWKSPAFPQTRNRFKGPWVNPYGWTSNLLAFTEKNADFVGLISGMAYFVVFRAVSRYSPNRKCHPFVVRAVAVG